jgi:DNA-binding response OmpR family regulator
MEEATMTHILVVDDDAKIRRLLRRCLEEEGYQISEAGSGAEATRLLETKKRFDLVTLDLHLPDCNGLEIGRQIRAQSRLPLIMVTAKGDPIDRIIGLELGADDYITKPFHLREVVARVRAVLRRTAESAGLPRKTSTLRFGDWILDPRKRELKTSSGKVCELTSSEFDLLTVFAWHPHHVLSRDQIMDLLRGHDWHPADRSIDNLVVRLRRKVESDPVHPTLIKTVRSAGYCFAADVVCDA